MANNEHKNLSNANLHVPKDFSTAGNSTTLTKDSSGNLSWISNTNLGCIQYELKGYLNGASNYKYPVNMLDDESPYQMTNDFGASSVGDGTLSVQAFHQMGMSRLIVNDSTVQSITGFVTCNSSSVVTIAVCKITPNPSSTAAITPVVIDEISVTGGNSNATLVQVDESTITQSSLSANDYLFAMVKETAEGETGALITFNLKVKTTTY